MIGWTKEKLFVLNTVIIAMIVTGSEFSVIRDAEINRLLKKLNKPPLKSIMSGDGDIIDCVHMKHHPIYDHPLFKNHTIQMRPSSYPEGWNNESLNTKNQSSMVTQLWTIKGRCPKNSIPIRRTKKEDILRAESIKKYGKKYPNNIPHSRIVFTVDKHEYAKIEMKGKFNGARALINVWKPYVHKKSEFSLAQIWVARTAPNSKHNTIEAGWQVYPDKYGDFNPRYFIFWTADGYQDTGCYNLDCPGFVLVNQEFAIGASVKDVSTLDGQQFDMPTTIWRDSRSGHWWLKLSTHTLIGYWPSKLFNLLQDGADVVQFGGEIVDSKEESQHTKTNMGSGHFAEEGYKKASYFRNIEIINENEIPQQITRAAHSMTKKHCYNISIIADHIVWGTFFYYGGPGQNPNCQ